jgi:hypothetical protein
MGLLRLADSQLVCLGVEPHLGSSPESTCFILTVLDLLPWCPPPRQGVGMVIAILVQVFILRFTQFIIA